MSHQELLRLANDSGYPLQISAQRAVRLARSKHQWTANLSEHSWTNKIDGKSGFIDLVVQNSAGVIFLAVECKRVRDSTWLFLAPDGNTAPVTRAKCWISNYQRGSFSRFDWHDVDVSPASPEAMFCAIRGQSSSERNTLLERTGSELVSATEAIADELRDYRSADYPNLKVFFNVLVTTADIQVASFDPEHLSIADGTLSDAEFKSVPFVRLRKQLLSRPTAYNQSDFNGRMNLSHPKEQTVFVVCANAFTDFLSSFDVSNDSLRPLLLD